mmetsp:Transcript_81978/g.206246  ORF Transcript_81978/g.206246 Transcript_81978/m.206246 type:complete len:225 (+) Transcript_81978:435-1109(+)
MAVLVCRRLRCPKPLRCFSISSFSHRVCRQLATQRQKSGLWALVGLWNRLQIQSAHLGPHSEEPELAQPPQLLPPGAQVLLCRRLCKLRQTHSQAAPPQCRSIHLSSRPTLTLLRPLLRRNPPQEILMRWLRATRTRRRRAELIQVMAVLYMRHLWLQHRKPRRHHWHQSQQQHQRWHQRQRQPQQRQPRGARAAAHVEEASRPPLTALELALLRVVRRQAEER